MTDHHHHGPARIVAASPTFSLLRLSAGARVLGAGAILACLWILVVLVLE
ncbi:MAG: hypothetical protein ABWY78_00085 [Microvirga sp.]